MIQRPGLRFIELLLLMGSGALFLPSTAFGQATRCADGFVQREAFAGDTVCVTPEARKSAAEQNENGRRYRKDADECLPGFVWRMAGPDDHVCVSEDERDAAQTENRVYAARSSQVAVPPLPELKIPGARDNVRSPPHQPGCHRYENGVWRETACLSEEFIRENFPPPTPQYSIKSNRRLLLTPIRNFTIPIVLGSVDVGHLIDPAAGTVTDSLTGTDAFSIQVNTNFFPANNGNMGWVQFVLQSDSATTVDALCVWNVDVTVAVGTANVSGYSPTCVAVPKQRTTFTAANSKGKKTTFMGPGATISERSQVAGYLGTPARDQRTLVAWAYVPWAPYSAYSVSAPDTYGLTGRWTEVSGDIMGIGNGSRAIFTNAKVRTVIQASVCVVGGASYPCPQVVSPALTFSFSASQSVTAVTAEDSNLKSSFDFGNHPPSFSCLKESCWLDYSTGLFSLVIRFPR